jgi:hypothetical protein
MAHKLPLQLKELEISLILAVANTTHAMRERRIAAPKIHRIFFKVRNLSDGSGITDIFFAVFRTFGRADRIRVYQTGW